MGHHVTKGKGVVRIFFFKKKEKRKKKKKSLQSTSCSGLKLVLGAEVPKTFGAGISRVHCLTVDAGSCKLLRLHLKCMEHDRLPTLE